MKIHPQNPWPPLSREALRARQARTLRAYLRDVVLPFHPHSREQFSRLGLSWRDIRTLEDLEKIPFTSKMDFQGENGENRDGNRPFVIAPDARELARRPGTIWRGFCHGRARVQRELEEEFRPILLTSTTGRSAGPVPFVYTAWDLENLKAAGIRLMELAGASRTDRLLSMFPFAPHLAFWQAHYAATAFGVFLLSTGGGKTLGTEGNLRLLAKIHPDVIIGMPTFVYHVLRQAVEQGLACGNLRTLVLGGEKAPEGLRQKLRHLAGRLGAEKVDVVSTYGFTEAKMAWCECRTPAGEEPSGYHVYPDLGIVEVIDPETGVVQEDGRPGEIVFTALAARGTCVLRYRTGDLIAGGLSHDPCPHCHGGSPRLVGRISRRSDFRELQMDKIKGNLVDFNALEHALDDLPDLGSWQVELRKANDNPHEVDELIVHAAMGAGGDEATLAREIENRLMEQTELRPNRIAFHTEAEICRLQGVGEKIKEQKVVDHRITGEEAS